MAAPAPEVDPLDFLRTNLDEAFDEARAATLFNLYCVEGPRGANLLAQDIRQLLYDLLTVVTLPCVVPDITLQAVFASIRACEQPEQRGVVTRDEMYAFLLTVVDDAAPPLQRILRTVQTSFDHARLGNAVYVLFRPQEAIAEDVYDRGVFMEVARTMIPNASDIFIYFVRSGDAMALVCVDGELPPFTSDSTVGTLPGEDGATQSPEEAERPPPILIEERPYFVDIAPFNPQIDIFPPARRSGGMRSRVARTLADTYVNARSWDESNYQIAAKTKQAAENAMERAKAFDQQHQISTRVAAKAAELDQQYDLSGKARVAGEKANEVISRVAANPTVQAAATKVGGYLKNITAAVSGGVQETSQLVQERRASDAERNAAAAAVAAESEAAPAESS